MSDTLRVGLAGVGTVGAGVLKILATNGGLIATRCGRPVAVTAVSARDRTKDRGVDLSGVAWEDDPRALAVRDDVDVVVEVMGGANGAALETVEAALGAGKDVVTANKALIATHGTRLATLAEDRGLALAFEAAVAGGIPVIKALKEGLAANRIDRVYGILNGTCNYILSDMETSGRAFELVLREAQALGYAEADPTFDVGGIDTAHKLAILAAVAFGMPVNFDAVHVEGIEQISAEDIAFARELGYRIKLLGMARRRGDGVDQRVHPCMVPLGAPIADVDGVENAVVTEGDAVGRTILVGRGAGEGPTASAVVADIVDIARGLRLPVFGQPVGTLSDVAPIDIAERVGVYYLRLTVVDKPGVMAAITTTLARHEVSIDQMIQRGRAPGAAVPVVIVTHETREAEMQAALAEISAFDTVREAPHLIRVVGS